MLGPDRGGRIIPAGRPDRTEQHGVGSAARRQRCVGEWRTGGFDGGSPHQCGLELEGVAALGGYRGENGLGLGDDFGADSVPGKQREMGIHETEEPTG